MAHLRLELDRGKKTYQFTCLGLTTVMRFFSTPLNLMIAHVSSRLYCTSHVYPKHFLCTAPKCHWSKCRKVKERCSLIYNCCNNCYSVAKVIVCRESQNVCLALLRSVRLFSTAEHHFVFVARLENQISLCYACRYPPARPPPPSPIPLR